MEIPSRCATRDETPAMESPGLDDDEFEKGAGWQKKERSGVPWKGYLSQTAQSTRRDYPPDGACLSEQGLNQMHPDERHYSIIELIYGVQ